MEHSTKDIEAALRHIPGVSAARLVTDESGRPIEIHVVAKGDKPPKQLVRDIQTVSIANFGVELDHRIISIVQFPENQVAHKRDIRPSIEEIGTEIKGKAAGVNVVLKSGDNLIRGGASGTNAREALIRTAAVATLKALNEICGEGVSLELDHVIVQRAGGQEVAVATVNLADHKGISSLSGSAVIAGLQTEAVVRAVLDAVNRRLWHEFQS